MIKNCIFLLLLFISNYCFTQNYVVIDTVEKEFYYDYNYKQDSIDNSRELYQEMLLQVGKKQIKFAAVNKILTDSILSSVECMDVNQAFAKVWSKLQGLRINKFCTYNLYKNYPNKNNIRFVGDLGSKKSLLVDEQINLNWQLQSDQDTTILGYSCQKATCHFAGRNYIAWYTLQIPISEGPYKFQGLPGLIVRISDVKKEHIFQLYKVKNCKKQKNMIYVREKNIQKTSAPKFAKAMKAHIADMYRKYGGTASPVKYNSPEQESEVLRNIRSKNNYIEKY